MVLSEMGIERATGLGRVKVKHNQIAVDSRRIAYIQIRLDSLHNFDNAFAINDPATSH
jgi:hypothetical protein